jgi:enterochelin esterase-like enzyme
MSVAIATDEVALRVEDPKRRFRAVHLVDELSKRRPPRPFVRRAGSNTWELHFPMPPVDRMEYLLELAYRDGRTILVPDPGNALRAPGPFGERSVLEFPGYRPPAWIAVEAPSGRLEPIAISTRRLKATVEGVLWSAAGADPKEPLPLLVVHDGPEYAEYSQLSRFLDAATATGRIPPLRAALLAPLERNQHYSASAHYASALAREVLPGLDRLAPRRGARIGMGASLGALAMLHVHRLYPGLFGGLFLQSGSFFRRRSDRQESDFVRFQRIARFMGGVLRGGDWPDPIPIGLTCGTAEENLGNNRRTAAALAAQGYPVALHEHRDAHNWTSWRDSFDPALPELIAETWR